MISNLYPPYVIGGYEMLASAVVDELRRRGHEVHVATGYGQRLPADGQTHGVLSLDLDHKEDIFLSGDKPKVGELIKWHLFNWRSYRGTRRLIRQLNPDVVAIWNLYKASLAPLIATQHERKPHNVYVADKWLCYSLWDLGGFINPSQQPQQRIVRLVRDWFQPLLRAFIKPKHVITVSDFIRGIYLHYGFPAEWLTTIHSGVRPELFTRRPASPAPDGEVRLLYMSSLWEGKGPQVAVRALGRLVRKGYVNLSLDIYGEGVENFKQWLRSLIAEEGVEARVRLLGFAAQDDVIAAYQTHDVVVFPSVWDEPFATVLLEAMSCGLAIVASTAGGTPEAIQNDETGLLVPPNDPDALALALERVIVDVPLRQRLGERAAQIARERFTVTYWVDRLEAYYTRITQAGT